MRGVTSHNAANNGAATTVPPEELSEAELLAVDDDELNELEQYESQHASKRRHIRPGFWLGAFLLLLTVADAAVQRYTGQPLLQLTHAVMLVGAVLAFLL